MSKTTSNKNAALSAGLVAVKGAANPVPDMPTRSPATEARAPKPKSKNTEPINFKMRKSFVREFKAFALERELKLNELLEECFEARKLQGENRNDKNSTY